jgi:putative ABC transport system permease protein
MWKYTVKGLLAHKLRLTLTAIAIVLGVTFISGTFILTDTLHDTFTTLIGNVLQNVDFQVRGVAQFPGDAGSAQRNPIPESILPAVRNVPGVEAASGTVSGYAQFVSRSGTAIASGGAPTEGISFDPDQRISELHLIAGRAPTTSSDVVMDAGTAHKYDFAVGDQVRILLPKGTQTFTISGIAQFGNADNLVGITLAAFDVPTAQHLLGEVGQFDDIDVVTTPGADKAMVQQDIQRILPPGVQVVTGQTVLNEQTTTIDQALSFFSNALLVFALISLFVGAFTILNTFSIIVGQRTRELALLRIVGASRRQLFLSVLGEAAIVGLVSSLIGIGLGVLAAIGLEALLRGFGISLPSGSPVFEARTVVVALLVGVGVTVIAAISPARRAVRIPPVVALGGQHAADDVSFRRRFAAGASLGLLGAVAIGVGLTQPSVKLVGLGAAALFVGVAMLAPALARPLSSAIGRPLARLLGMAGRLGRENSMRSPRRTAQTASALMVGLALVSAIAVFGASASRSATSSVDHAISADLIITASDSGGQGSFSNAVPKVASAVPGVTATATGYGGQFELRSSVENLIAVPTANLAQTVILRLTAGTVGALAAGDLLVDSTTASSDHLTVGETVPVKFALTGRSTMRIGGIYQPNALLGDYLVSSAFYLQHYQNPLPGAVLLKTTGAAGIEAAVTRALAPYPNVQVQTRAQFEKSQNAQVDKLLGLIYALLGLAVIIALIGIVNTLMLSVFERTREIGVLRAVGMRRRQVRAMIRSEAVILAIFGAAIGIVIGTGMGVALVSALRSQGITDTVVPVTSIVIFLILSVVLGLIAAIWPARRAAKLDVLAAIATD